MSKHIFQLRRGWKDDSGRDDWAEYTKQPNHVRPLEGELVLEYDNGIPRLKIGDGLREFAELEYLSVDSFILPTQASIDVYADRWLPFEDEDGNVIENRYYQEVAVKNAVITPNSKVDLQITPEDLVVFHEKDVSFTTVNDDGKVRVCIVGKPPANNYTFKATITEVTING